VRYKRQSSCCTDRQQCTLCIPTSPALLRTFSHAVVVSSTRQEAFACAGSG
jgi:hypothetical protein